jgi:hypothetical protein
MSPHRERDEVDDDRKRGHDRRRAKPQVAVEARKSLLGQEYGADREEDEACKEIQRLVECHRAKRGAAVHGFAPRQQKNLKGLPSELRPGRQKADAETRKAVERKTAQGDGGAEALEERSPS